MYNHLYIITFRCFSHILICSFFKSHYILSTIGNKENTYIYKLINYRSK